MNGHLFAVIEWSCNIFVKKLKNISKCKKNYQKRALV